MIEEASDSPARESRELRIHHLVKQVAEVEGFPLFELNFDEDSTGEPAVWVSFLLDHDYPTTKAGIEALTRVGQRVKSALFANDIDLVPYIRFRERQKAAG